MVDLRTSDEISRLVIKRTQMTISEFIPFLGHKDLANFYQLNKTCKAILTPGDPKCLRFNVLLAKQNTSNWHDADWR